jgi:hypothetical protein
LFCVWVGQDGPSNDLPVVPPKKNRKDVGLRRS